MINDSILESDDDENEENENKKGRPLAKLCILKNAHITERGKGFTTAAVMYFTFKHSLPNSHEQDLYV